MSNGMEFTIPPTPSNKLTDADLVRLTGKTIADWVRLHTWTIDEACALLRGFVPLESWESDHSIRSLLLQVHTAPLKGELNARNRALPDQLPPAEWLKLADKCGKVDLKIRLAILKAETTTEHDGSNKIPKHLETARPNIMKWAEEIYLTSAKKRESTSTEAIAKKLADQMKRNGLVKEKGNGKGDAYSWTSVEKWFLRNWKRPDLK